MQVQQFRRPTRWLLLLGLTAAIGLGAMSGDADAVVKKNAKVRPARAHVLKAPGKSKVKPAVPTDPLFLVGMACSDNPGGGALVRAVTDGGLAQSAGLEVGDIIVAVEDIPVSTTGDLRDLLNQAIILGFADVRLTVIDVRTGQTGPLLLQLPPPGTSGPMSKPSLKPKSK